MRGWVGGLVRGRVIGWVRVRKKYLPRGLVRGLREKLGKMLHKRYKIF